MLVSIDILIRLIFFVFFFFFTSENKYELKHLHKRHLTLAKFLSYFDLAWKTVK